MASSHLDKKTNAAGPQWRVKVQRLGSLLSGLIMPNIGAFIAWGLITALFIPTGWVPNENLAKLVDPMIKFLLPLLIGFTGGNMIYGARGGVVGATATLGVIVGADIPMFLGAMIMGPLSGWVMKKVDRLFEGRVRSGFEMLVNNFSAGIIAALLTIAAYLSIGPVVLGLNKTLAQGVEGIIGAGLLPLANIFIEPAKVLFLNNAINHGILSPIGLSQAAESGKSILFLLETNPGPGLGILLAYWLFGKGTAKQSAPGAAVIHFLGGIHEIYFPYILMKPVLILAAIAGGVSGVFTFSLFGAGLVAVPSPGSIFALLAMTPRGGYLGVLSGVLVAGAVSFLVASIFLKRSAANEEDNFEAAARSMEAMKGKKSMATTALTGSEEGTDTPILNGPVKKIVFACDAGMGSSAMGASVLKKKVQQAELDIEVTNTSISKLPKDADIVITHKSLTDRAKEMVPDAYHISVDNFLSSPEYDTLIKRLKSGD
ncbi:PTS system mannitol-specific EIICB component [Marinithermofilum abyssi]|uniref:PTS system mannitol-specific EIICB component n=1 Tax=Marinithermofilum abyssi TaxID=1571185 RepID=A0A8J2VD96_9BACL|nr:PTS mannitol transporter subunit IICB [Marinithermofilum abyssi]GGE24505.1 PTS system mannitol-specific EIICB component [Marinithermofilum abyssi]